MMLWIVGIQYETWKALADCCFLSLFFRYGGWCYAFVETKAANLRLAVFRAGVFKTLRQFEHSFFRLTAFIRSSGLFNSIQFDGVASKLRQHKMDMISSWLDGTGPVRQQPKWVRIPSRASIPSGVIRTSNTSWTPMISLPKSTDTLLESMKGRSKSFKCFHWCLRAG